MPKTRRAVQLCAGPNSENPQPKSQSQTTGYTKIATKKLQPKDKLYQIAKKMGGHRRSFLFFPRPLGHSGKLHTGFPPDAVRNRGPGQEPVPELPGRAGARGRPRGMDMSSGVRLPARLQPPPLRKKKEETGHHIPKTKNQRKQTPPRRNKGPNTKNETKGNYAFKKDTDTHTHTHLSREASLAEMKNAVSKNA